MGMVNARLCKSTSATDGPSGAFAMVLSAYRQPLIPKDATSFLPCMRKEDAMGYGVPYWHCEHQIPGVSICNRHCCRLMPKLVPPSPHIAVEFYPDNFNTMILSKNIENDFAVFANQILTHGAW